MSGNSIRAAFLGVLMGGLAVAARAEQAKPLPIVAAENFYGDIAKQIGTLLHGPLAQRLG